MPLTGTQIKQATGKGKSYRIWDERGLCGIAMPQGDRTLPLSQVMGWCLELPTRTQIFSDTGWLATIVGFDPSDGTYRVEGTCIVGWLYPEQFSVQLHARFFRKLS